MDYQMIATIVIIIVAMVLFSTEMVRIDVVAVGIIVVLVVFGILEPEQGFKGFSNTATLTVAAMFVLSGALIKAGVISIIAPLVTKLFNKSYALSILGMSLSIGIFSAFVNNTPVVATFIPIVSSAANKIKQSTTKYLIPLSYAAIFGGTCTLIGTSTNLLVAGIARDNGINTIGLFTMAPIGLACATVGILYLTFGVKWLLPEESKSKPLQDEKEIKEFLTEVEIKDLPDDKEKTVSLRELFQEKDLSVKVSQIKRGDRTIKNPDSSEMLQNGDTLLIAGNIEKVKQIVADKHLEILKSIKDKNFPEEKTKLLEIVILPGAEMAEQKLKDINFLRRYSANVLAIRHRGKRSYKNLADQRLKVGDVLLLQTNEKGYKQLKDTENKPHPAFISVQESVLVKTDKKDLTIVGIVLLSVILLATLNILPIVVAAWAGIVILAASKVFSMTEAYRSIDWQVIFLLAGSLSLGEAMTKSGVSDLIADYLYKLVENPVGPMLIIAVVYLMTAILTEIMSNNASAALMAPIAIALASAASFNPTALLVTVMIAGSASFLTPIGYQTNTMVYSAGNYEFTDFTKAGAPLTLIFWVISSLLIPIVFPLN